ncbi:hypothetical protein [Rothia nasimurium]|uniref:hypothetical protein n=1 Tax=Rothia nasimurium TaxID=85336 RepID=UPI001F43AC2E|nr:hypothetical protein [Rothia nasimurium]
MVERKKKDGEQWLARAVSHARPEAVRDTFTTSIQRVSRIPGHVGEFSGRAAGVLTRKDARTVRVRLILTTVFVTLLAVLVAAVGNYLSLTHIPEDSVDRYMSALERGDYIAGIDRGAYSDFTYTYLTNSIYRAAQGRVENYTITGTSKDATGQVTASVLATVAGQDHQLTLPLTQVPRTGPFNDSWQLATPAQSYLTLTAPVALAGVQVNGQSLDLPVTRRTETEAGYQWVIPILPGTYEFTLPSSSYYTLNHADHVITAPLPGQGPATQELTLDVRPSPRMWNETNNLITSWLERCESARRLDVAGCPTSLLYGEDSTATISNVSWELTDRPAFYLVPDRTDPRIWRASRYRQATFEVTYLADGKAQREIIPFYINAEVVSDGAQASISVGLGGSEESEAQLREAITSEDAAKSTLQKFVTSLENTP